VLGFKIQGRLTTARRTVVHLQIKSFDVAGGLTTALNQGEIVNSADVNTVTSQIKPSFNFLTCGDFTGRSGQLHRCHGDVGTLNHTHDQ
jgi:hypothetical protein